MEVSPCSNVSCFQWATDCAAIVRAAEAAGWTPGAIARGEGAGPVGEVRRCNVSLGIPPQALAEVALAVKSVGKFNYGFDVEGLSPADPTLVMRYEPGDHFTWHVDNGVAGPPMGSRKLSFTLQLSSPEDYDGGDLEFAVYSSALNPEIAGPSPVLRQRGALIVFPSFMLHRVSPVTRGTRFSLVGWVHGPPFR